jgi:hypothetical protein
MAELDRGLSSGSVVVSFRQIPVEDGQRALGLDWHYDVERNVIGIAVQHPIGKNPKVVRGQILTCQRVSAWGRVSRLGAADRTKLAHVPRVGLDHVRIEVKLPVEAGMHTRQMVAFEIVVHVGFPVALHVVSAPLKQLHFRERKTLRLSR